MFSSWSRKLKAQDSRSHSSLVPLMITKMSQPRTCLFGNFSKSLPDQCQLLARFLSSGSWINIQLYLDDKKITYSLVFFVFFTMALSVKMLYNFPALSGFHGFITIHLAQDINPARIGYAFRASFVFGS
jgi:hypothetical protein